MMRLALCMLLALGACGRDFVQLEASTFARYRLAVGGGCINLIEVCVRTQDGCARLVLDDNLCGPVQGVFVEGRFSEDRCPVSSSEGDLRVLDFEATVSPPPPRTGPSFDLQGTLIVQGNRRLNLDERVELWNRQGESFCGS